MINKEFFCYEVTVKTTNACDDTTCVPFDSEIGDKAEYYDCEDSILYAITDDPKKIYGKFKDAVIKISKVGPGYLT